VSPTKLIAAALAITFTAIAMLATVATFGWMN
jgi:hypothetical protein